MKNSTWNSVSGPNAIHPDFLTPTERRAEVSKVLAIGYLRLKARQMQAKGDHQYLQDNKAKTAEKPDKAARPEMCETIKR